MKNKLLVILILILVVGIMAACISPQEAGISGWIDDVEDWMLGEDAFAQTGDAELKKATTLYDSALVWMTSDYRESNQTQNESHRDRPSEITQIIRSQADFERAFEEFPRQVDFSDQMIVVYFFTADNLFTADGKRLFYYELAGVDRQEQVLYLDFYKIKTTLQIPHDTIPDSSMPTQECLVFLTPRMDITQAQFRFRYREYYKIWKGELKSNTTLDTVGASCLTEQFRACGSFPAIIQSEAQLHAAFQTFSREIDLRKQMLIVCQAPQQDAAAAVQANTYTITDVRYEYGQLDITLATADLQTSDTSAVETSAQYLIFRLPQLPVYHFTLKPNE